MYRPQLTCVLLGHIVAVLRRSPATVEHQDRHHAVVLTELLPEALLDRSPGSVIELNVCQELGGAGVTVLGSVEPEDVRLLPLRCVNASASVYEGT